MTRWIMPNHDLETAAYIYDKPWRSTTTHIDISVSPKDIAGEEHIQLLRKSLIQVDIFMPIPMVPNVTTAKQVQAR
jgi:hypothetical protein